jgi:hypothetical protein
VKQPLTLLQRGVIQRLREASLSALADMPTEHWSRGQPIPGPVNHGEITQQGLAADLIRANEHSRGRSEE